MATSIKIPVVSFFSGAGGMDLGFRWAGMRALLALDNDAAAIRSYNFNAKRKTARQVDLTKLSCERLSDLLRESANGTKPRGVIGGPPCQGFSRGNASANPDDPRNKLPYCFLRLLKALNESDPIDFFVFENVPGLKFSKHKRRYKTILTKLANIGFRLFERQLDAINFGVPQFRRRLFIVGINRDLPSAKIFKFPEAQSAEKTVRDAIGHLPDPVFRNSSMRRCDIPFHSNHWTMPPISRRFTDQNFNQGRSFRQLSWDAPSRTVAYGNREIHVHPNGRRRLSILEGMLLQGFPQSYVLSGNFSQQVDQVSNAVPPPMAHEIGLSIRNQLYRDSSGKPILPGVGNG